MSFFGKLVRSFISPEVSPEEVIEVRVSAYTHTPIIARDEGLILYGPNNEGRYELLLQQPIEINTSVAFSFFRLTNQQSAQDRFVILKDIINPLSESDQFFLYSKDSLQKILSIHSSHQTWSAAHIAAEIGNTSLFQSQAVAKFANTADLEWRETPLHIAIKNKDLNMINVLLRLNVSLDCVDVKGMSVYHLAATSNKQVIECLTKNTKNILLNAPNLAGKTPLHIACEADLPECVTALLSAGADVNVASVPESTLAIHSAMVGDSATCAKEILTRYPNMLHVQDMKLGGTPLHWAKSKNMINALVELKCQVNARNFEGKTALHLMTAHDRLGCVLALLSHNANPSLTDNEGNTPLHYAKSIGVLQALLVFDAPLTMKNNERQSLRHIISCSSYTDKAVMLHMVHALGAERCETHLPSCGSGCSPVGTYDGVQPQSLGNVRERTRSEYDSLLNVLMESGSVHQNDRSGDRLLALDGGGIRGLVLIILIREIQRAANDAPITSLFDWIAGSSTGAILALALSLGRSPIYALCLYFRLKDDVFKGSRPYSAIPLEETLKREFGEATVMSDIKNVKVVVTGVLADRFPADLHLFRNYSGGENLFKNERTSPSSGSAFDVPPPLPSSQLVWEAARCSGAAPSYFRAYGRFIDGGMIANNPSLDLLTEIHERNVVLRHLKRDGEVSVPRVLVSLGTGRPPLEEIKAIDCFRPESMYSTLQMAFGLSNMAKLLIDQVTMADNSTVDRCRSWCSLTGVRYLRLSPQLSADIPLDTTDDALLLNMLWETKVYAHQHRRDIIDISKMLLKQT